MRRLVLASGNAGKLREFRALLAPLQIEVISQAELAIAPADEPYATFVENALTKARHAAAASGLPALADDSGLSCPALGGCRACGRRASPAKQRRMPTTMRNCCAGCAAPPIAAGTTPACWSRCAAPMIRNR
jgi:Na+-translocating ferredoxin:NAD+ oxidoreductase RNF subunit RnfB